MISGITFTLDGNGEHRTAVTDRNGSAYFTGLKPGTYTVTETIPQGYQSTEGGTITKEVQTGQTVIFTFHNKVIRGGLKIIKTASDNHIVGIPIHITGNGVDQTLYTGEGGIIDLPSVKPGIYVLEEIVPDGYVCDKQVQTVEVKANTQTTVTFVNTKEKGKVQIVKESDDGVVGNIEFTIQGGSINQKVTTGPDGTITVEDLVPGTYTITETVPEFYDSDFPVQSVDVEPNKTTVVHFHNTRQKGSLKIIKTSSDGIVSGFEFTVKGGTVNTRATSGDDGTITVPDLVPGQYEITELVPEKYLCENPTQTVTVKSGETAEVHFVNQLKMWRLTVTKEMAEPEGKPSLSMAGAQYGLYLDGALQDTYTTDEKGQFTTKEYPCAPGWTLQELKPPVGCVLDPTSYPVGLEPGSASLAKNDLTLTVQDTVIQGKLQILKQDGRDQEPLQGAEFTVYNEKGEEAGRGQTGQDGLFVLENLPYGKYTARETKAPDGYDLDESEFSFSIEEDGKTVTVTRDNTMRVGSIQVHKVNSRKNDLSGAEYLLEYSLDGQVWNPVTARDKESLPGPGFCTSEGLREGKLTTGSSGLAVFEGLAANGKVQYRLTETRAPAGYSLLPKPVLVGTLPAGDGSVYDVRLTATDSQVSGLPMTGGSGSLPVALGVFLAGAALCGLFACRKNHQKRRN